MIVPVSDDEEHIVTGGTDSKLVVWKDVTEETLVEASNTRQERALQEQQLANLLNSDKLLPALKLALSLERPAAVYSIIESKKQILITFTIVKCVIRINTSELLSI